ncbi:MAG: methyltransferase [Piscirickettsiaceae bacterium]|nr:MAG: methyltransferase [Piscirickettsiaceae bacterium]
MTFAMCLSLLAGITQADDLTLSRIIASDHRLETNKTRDQYRHPLQTLEFMGIKAEMTVIEVWPSKGWYTELLAPFLKQGGGKFIAAGFPQHAGPKWRQTMQRNYIQWMAKSPAYYDQADIIELGPPDYWKLGTENSVDAVLSFRNVHNWLKGGYENNMFSAFYRVIKPGGFLGITDHRAYPDTDIETMKQSGYLSERLVISLAEQAGFVLEATSEINANKKDTKTHIKGVWTLPPTLRLGEKDRAKYLAIGESDRMTLRFRKPK